MIRTARTPKPRPRKSRGAQVSAPRARIALEHLEDRTVPSLVAAWGFEEGAGASSADQTGRGHTAALSGAAWAAAGKFGRALSFDGSTSWATVADAADLRLTTGMTVE